MCACGGWSTRASPRAWSPSWSRSIREITTEILDEVAPRGACDFVTDVAAQLPLAVICAMMGVPREDWPLMFDLTNKVLGADDPEYQTEEARPTRDGGAAARRADVRLLRAAGRGAATERPGRPGQRADRGGDRRREADREGDPLLLLPADPGRQRDDAQRHLRRPAGAARAPGGARAAARRPALLPTAVEEILRWTSPVMHMARTATRDTELRGKQIRAGEKVAAVVPVGQPRRGGLRRARPLRHRPHAERRTSRSASASTSASARASRGWSCAVMFETLLRRLPDIELAGEVERLRSNFIGGIKHMPVRFTRKRQGRESSVLKGQSAGGPDRIDAALCRIPAATCAGGYDQRRLERSPYSGMAARRARTLPTTSWPTAASRSVSAWRSGHARPAGRGVMSSCAVPSRG